MMDFLLKLSSFINCRIETFGPSRNLPFLKQFLISITTYLSKSLITVNFVSFFLNPLVSPSMYLIAEDGPVGPK